jgi:hypothetical protein
MSEPLETTVFEAFVSASTGKPFIQMTCAYGDNEVFVSKMRPSVATALGLRAIQAAIEAERDAGFVKFVRDGMDMDDRAAGMMLSGLREFRQQFDAEEGSMRPLSGDDPSSLRDG